MKDFKLRAEDELLICCARTKVEPEIKEKMITLINEDLDWGYLLQIASRHRLMPLLYYNLNSVCAEDVPDDILKELKDYFNANVRRNLLLTGELIKILKLLKNEGIEAIPYKGPVLASLAYGSLSLREFGDIDIFINESDAVNAKNILLSDEYELYNSLDIYDSFYMKLEPEFQLINKNNNAMVEIKWKFQGNFFSLPKNLNLLSDGLEKFEINGFEVETFSVINHILILCIHNAKHNWNNLSWICDVSELLKNQKNINWQELLKKSDKLSIKRILLINLLLAKDLFQLELPDEILGQIYNDHQVMKISNRIKKRLFLKENSLNIFQKFILDLRKREKIKYGLNDCIYGLTRPTYVDYGDISLPESLYSFYYLIRPFLLLKRYGKDSI